MLYALFLFMAFAYNWWKFTRERSALFTSLIEAKSTSHREMILGHHFYVFIFEAFLAFIVAHFITERAFSIGLLGLGMVYIVLLFLGFMIYLVFVRHLERRIQVDLSESFHKNLIRELRVNFALVLLPILIYSLINLTFQGSVVEEWGNLWFIGFFFHIIFVSVLTIACTVIIMLKLVPNREITEPEYLEIIDRRLMQVGMPSMRVRWIESDIKNAFIVGIKLLKFSNQTMFVGRGLRTTLTLEEFDAVICHELGHVANRHVHKRMIDLLKNFASISAGIVVIMLFVIGGTFLYWGEDATVHTQFTAGLSALLSLGWIIFNYGLLFDTIRSHELEADAYAVMELGVNFAAMQSALEKLTAPDDLPDYLKVRTKRVEKGWLATWAAKHFSTHPALETRVSFLREKMQRGLPFNYYISRAQRIWRGIGYLLRWKVAVPVMAVFFVFLSWMAFHLKQGQETVAWISKAPPEEIMGNQELAMKINSSPTLIGPSYMSYIVRRGDAGLLEHFIGRGADKGKTLVYISKLRDFKSFKKYYAKFRPYLSKEDQLLILRKTAQENFTEGHSYLVNGSPFEGPSQKENAFRVDGRKRSPASSRK